MRLNALPSLLFGERVNLGCGRLTRHQVRVITLPAGSLSRSSITRLVPVTMAFRNAVIALKCAVERTKYKQYD
jgi:hypothetical protein